MKWLITGGCGFLGTALIARLRQDGGHQIRVFDNLSVGRLGDLEPVTDYAVVQPESWTDGQSFAGEHEPVQVVIGDITDSAAICAAMADVEVVVHLAAATGVIPSIEDPLADCRSNVIGTLNTLEAARLSGAKGFVFASSGAPLGEQEPPIHEGKAPRPCSPYGASKLAGEGYCSAFAHSYGLCTVALRFGNVYGPGSARKESVVAKFIKQALDGETLTIFGDGKQTRDFIFIEDLVDAVVRAGRHDRGGEVFQIAMSQETTVNEVVEILGELLQSRAGIRLQAQFVEARAGEVLRMCTDTTKAREHLGWQSRHSMAEGLSKTVDWFLQSRLSPAEV